MNNFNGFPEFTIKDFEDALYYLLDGNERMINQLAKEYNRDRSFIIDSANVKLTQSSFFKYYANQILTHFHLLYECPKFISIDNNQFNWFVVGANHILEHLNGKHIDIEHQKILLQYSITDMYFPIIKNGSTVQALKKIIKPEQIKNPDTVLEKGLPFHFRILPTNTHKTLNNLIRGIYQYT